MESIKSFLLSILNDDRVAYDFPTIDSNMGSYARNSIYDIYSLNSIGYIVGPMDVDQTGFGSVNTNSLVYKAPRPEFIFEPFVDYDPQSLSPSTDSPKLINGTTILTTTRFIEANDTNIKEIDPDVSGINWAFDAKIPDIDNTVSTDGTIILTDSSIYFFDGTNTYSSTLATIEDYSQASGTIDLSNINTGYFIEIYDPYINRSLSVTPSTRRLEMTWSYIVLGVNTGATYLCRIRKEGGVLVMHVLAYTETGTNFSAGETMTTFIHGDGYNFYNVNTNNGVNSITYHTVKYEKDYYRDRGSMQSSINFNNAFSIDFSNTHMLPEYRSTSRVIDFVKIGDYFYILYSPSNTINDNVILKTDLNFDVVDIIYPYPSSEAYNTYSSEHISFDLTKTIPNPVWISTDGTYLYSVDNGIYGQAPDQYPAYSVVKIPHTGTNPVIEFYKTFSNRFQASIAGIGGTYGPYNAYVKTRSTNDYIPTSINSLTTSTTRVYYKLEFDWKYDHEINNVIVNVKFV